MSSYTELGYRANAAGPEGPILADGARLLGELRDTMAQIGRLTARAVGLVDEVQRSGTVEQLEGLPLDLLLGLELRLTGGERWMLVTAAQVLRHLPATRALFAAGRLSWSQVRGIVGRARGLAVEQRGQLDERISASAELVDRLHPDQLQWAVDRAADALEGARRVQRRERGAREHSFLAVQTSFDGAGRIYGEFDPAGTATVLNALDAAAAAPTAEACEPGEPTIRARQRAAALVDICAGFLGRGQRTQGPAAAGGPRRPRSGHYNCGRHAGAGCPRVPSHGFGRHLGGPGPRCGGTRGAVRRRPPSGCISQGPCGGRSR